MALNQPINTETSGYSRSYRRLVARNPGYVIVQAALAVLRRYGQDAHIYLPGVGMLNGLQAGNYLDSAGTTAGTVDQPVGLVLDAAGGLGVELVTNGDFSDGATGWFSNGTAVPSFADGVGRLTSVSTAQDCRLYASIPTVIGKTYRVKGQLVANTSGSTGSLSVGNGGGFSTIASVAAVANKEYELVFVAVQTTQYVWFGFGQNSGQYFEADNISVREVTGIAASQPTTASKPILRRGAVNLLTYNGGFSNAAWLTKTSIQLFSGVADPLGGTSAFTLQADSATTSVLQQAIAGTTATVYTGAVWVRRRTGSGQWAIRTSEVAAQNITVTNDWTCVAFTNTSTSTTIRFGIISVSGVNGDQIDIYRAALFQGTYTAQQIQALGGIPLTTTAPASTALGPHYFQFDGSNDSLSLGSVPFQMSDDICVIASASSTLASSERTVFSVTGAVANNPLCPSLVFGSDSRFKAYWRNDAGALDQSGQTGAVQALGSMFVVSALKVGNSKTLRVNGALQSGASGTNLGATTLTAANIGAFVNAAGASGGNLQGSTGPIIAIKGTVSDPDLLLLEKFVGQLSGVQI